ncbi:ferric reductase-like transmembrane domain-containing protein [Plantactinospora siamensis]|uniref:Ferric reductase-like transmembrane domain-containing protein n=1 Tax=Plantactinospora siamensis TaxID=555372 RepID=A0ABV6NZM8_9ACTN
MSTATLAPPRAGRRLPVTPRWWADLAGSAGLLSLVIVTALWVANRGLQELTGGAGPGLTSAGRLAGLLAADLMLIQVVLMARVPWIERSYGQDRIARWHRLAGFTSFNLLLGHVLLITVGYATTTRTGLLAQIWLLVASYPGMLLATAALALLVMVVVTSLRAARRRLRYESWHLLHLYAYLGTALALPHQLWTGADFVSSPAARAYWWALYIGAAGSVLVFRLGVPAWRSARHRLEVTAVVGEGRGVTSVYLRGRRLDRLPVRAGQFFCWRFLDGPGWSRAHPYSLSAPPHGDRLRITVKDLGDGSSRVAGLRPGTRVLIEGPYGRLTGETWRGGPVTMLACGVGITPLLALLHELPYAPGEAVLVYRARTAADLAFREEIERLAAYRGVRVHYLLGPRARRRSWLPRDAAHVSDVDALRWIAPDLDRHDVYVCGPEEWTAAARDAATAAGVPAPHVHLERFAW